MDYTRIHDSLINRAKNRLLEGYSENHHIIPKCLGGTDDANNLVRLTAAEHYVVHQLLVKMHPGHKGLIYAAHMMSVGRINNKQYGWLKRKFSATHSVNHSKAMKGRKYSEEHKQNMSIAAKKLPPKSAEHRAKISETLKGNIPWNKGMKGCHSTETRAKMSAALKGKPAWNKGRKRRPETLAKMMATRAKTMATKKAQSDK